MTVKYKGRVSCGREYVDYVHILEDRYGWVKRGLYDHGEFIVSTA